MEAGRKALARSRRIIVKIGSNALADHPELIPALAEEVAELSARGASFLLVSSGAVALSWRRLGYRRRPREIPELQASAAAGQSVLMQRYSEAFAATNRVAAQVLLTHSDLTDRERVNNARQALAALLDARAVPIINENDTVATEEIRFGDNDQLASMVTPLVGADLLLLLTDVEGVLDDAGSRIPLMQDDLKVGTVKTAGHGTGGIASKIDAARKASRAGASVVIGSALRERIITDVILGKDVGTLFVPHPSTLRARRHWIMYTLRPRGDVLLDDGAARALRGGRSSLLPVGVLGVRGDFRPSDAIRLVTSDGTEIGRGLARLGSADVARSAGKKGADLDAALGRAGGDEVVVHKDDLVVLA